MSNTQVPDEDAADTRPAPASDESDARSSNPSSAETDPRTATDTPASPRIKNK